MAETDKSGQMVRSGEKKKVLAKELLRLQPEIAKALPSHLDPERMARIALTALRTTPKLNECTVQSFLGSVLTLAQLGLEPNTPMGHAYLIPRKIDGLMECTTIIGYEGWLELMYRSGKVSLVYAHVVRNGSPVLKPGRDLFDYDYGLDRTLVHKPLAPDEVDFSHVYAVAILNNGQKAFVVLTKAQVEHAKKSAQGLDRKSSPWNQHTEAMWCKTAVQRLRKYTPRSTTVQQAAAFDEAPQWGAKQTQFLSHEVREQLESQGIDVDADETPEQEVA